MVRGVVGIIQAMVETTLPILLALFLLVCLRISIGVRPHVLVNLIAIGTGKETGIEIGIGTENEETVVIITEIVNIAIENEVLTMAIGIGIEIAIEMRGEDPEKEEEEEIREEKNVV
jgi:hypothetical protein